MATDASGVIHLAASTIVDASGKYMAVYARCAGSVRRRPRDGGDAGQAGTGHVPTIALTQERRPRITYYTATGALPGLHFLECDGSCTSAGSWKDVRLANTIAINPFRAHGSPSRSHSKTNLNQ